MEDDLEDAIPGCVLITFTNTRGGTELGVRIDETLTDLSGADFEQGGGIVHLADNLVLNYVKVCCVADIDLAGHGISRNLGGLGRYV